MQRLKITINIGLLMGLLSLSSCANKKPTDRGLSNFTFIEDHHGLNLNLNIAINDFGTVNKYAKKLNKPILTIYGCLACFGYPKGIWQPLADKEVNSILQENFLIRYYQIDDKTQLPDSLSKELVETVGEYFRTKQINTYQISSQPLYTITDWEENDLVKPIGYVEKNESTKFKDFILEALN